MFSSTIQHRWFPIAMLGVIVILGSLLRWYDYDKNTIGHIEIYVPGIDLPYDLSNPAPRHTLRETLAGVYSQEPHPPGYYVMMLGWTKLFGTSVLALRSPSILFGIASIVLIYLIGALEEDKWTALLAAGMLAFHGFHIFWSQIAKMYYMGCFLGLLSTLLLLWMTKKGTWQRPLQFLYVGVTLAGLSTVVFFWLILFTQMLWVLLRGWTRASMPALFRLQWVVLILGSPLWALAALQNRRPSYLDEDLLAPTAHFFQFGFLFEPEEWLEHPYAIPMTATVLLVLFTVFLLIVGLISNRNQLPHKEAVNTASVPSVVVILSAVFSVIFILRFAEFTQDTLVLSFSIAPIILLCFDFLLRRYWGHIQTIGIHLEEKLILLRRSSSLPLYLLLAIVPIALIIAVSLFKPVFASRTALLYTPYLLIVISRGLVSLIEHNRRWAIALLIVAVSFSFGLIHYKNRLFHPNDYRGLAEQWIPKIQDSDLIFVQRHWATTPIFYYLRGDKYKFVGRNYVQATHQSPTARVWVLSFEGLPDPEEMHEALVGYQPLMSLESLRTKVELYGYP